MTIETSNMSKNVYNEARVNSILENIFSEINNTEVRQETEQNRLDRFVQNMTEKEASLEPATRGLRVTNNVIKDSSKIML